MHKRRSHPLKFNAGCAVDADIYYMAAHMAAGPDDDCDVEFGPPAYMLFYQHQTTEKWFHHELCDWQVESTAFIPPGTDSRPRRVCALSEDGRLEDYSRAETRIEHVQQGMDPKNIRGGLSRVRLIGDTLFCCGMSGRIYERSAAGWKQIPTNFPEQRESPLNNDDYAAFRNTFLDFIEINQLDSVLPIGEIEREQYIAAKFEEAKQHQPQFEALDPETGISLQDLTGAGRHDLYVIGEAGLIAHWNGVTWQICPPVTTNYLWHCRMTSSGAVIVVADEATILVGTVHEGFTAVALTNTPDADFRCSCEFGDLIYIGSNRGIFTHQLGTNTVEHLKAGLPKELRDAYIVDIDSAGGVLWVLTTTTLGRFAGNTWQLFSPPTA